MKIASLRVLNFRCFKEVEITIQSMHALVGANNAGKSTILKALDLLFNPSTTKITEESFWHKDTSNPIRIEGTFVDLTKTENEALATCLRPDGTFKLARVISLGGSSDGDDEAAEKIGIKGYYQKPQPKYAWLVAGKVNGKAIAEWLKKPEELVVQGESFHKFLEGKKTVGDWQAKAAEFVTKHLKPEDFEEQWVENPQGYPNVLKNTLPHFELIPAVREAADESKVSKTNPFGRLVGHMASTLEATLKQQLEKQLKETTRRLNREAKEERLQGVAEIESSMQAFLSELMEADLELEFQSPTVEMLLSTPKIFVNDGFRGAIDGKGHGLQRAVIFSILRTYAKLVTTRVGTDRRTLILGVEEPELYMHPTAQRMIRSVLRTIANGQDQVIFSTHSPILVDVAYFDEIIRVEGSPPTVNGKLPDNGAKIHQLPMSALIDDLHLRHKGVKPTEESMRERYAHAYTPSRNEGFFAKQIILCEGQTETYSLPIFARALKKELDMLGIAVVDCGGKDSMDRLYRIFNELGIPCFMLFDYDHGKTSAVKVSKELLKLLRHPEENLTQHAHGPTFSCFHKKWEDAVREEVPSYDDLAKEASDFLGTSSSKPLEARFIASKLVAQSPPFVPPSLKTIIENALNVNCRGSCLTRPATTA